MDAAELRTRARALVQNVPYIARAIESLVSHTIGTGISPRSLADGAMAERVDALWDRWAEQADADGLGNFYSLQARAYRAMEVDGEVLIRIRPRTSADGLAVPMQLQLLEIDWLDSSKNGTVGGNSVVNGIEYTPRAKLARTARPMPTRMASAGTIQIMVILLRGRTMRPEGRLSDRGCS